MQLITEAYAILSNPVKRAQYDFLRRYTDQPLSSHPTRSEPRASRPAYAPHARPGLSAGQPQPGYYAEAGSEDNWVSRVMLLVSELVYHLVRDSLVLLLYSIPLTLYFILLGNLSVWLSPGLAESDNYLMGKLFVGSAFLTYLTVRLFRKRIRVRDFFQRLRF